MSNKKFVKLGQDMWLEMLGTFMFAGESNGAKTPEQMAAMWAGYLAAAAGSGTQVFGKENMLVIMRTVMKSVEEFEAPKPELKVVGGYDGNREQN